jgi:2-keto-3-deoxy-L-rhamnonate aldolase RhmA
VRANRVKRALRSGGLAFGTCLFEFATPGIARILAAAGAEFAFYDMEHNGLSLETIRDLMATARCTEIVPLVRVPATEYHFIARVLDVGAMGVVVPMVETREQAELVVQCAKYAPMGRRGCAFGVAHDDYAGGDLVEKMRSANEEILVAALIESERGVQNVDQILAVPGVDVAWVGHFDLSQSMGIPGQFDHPRFVEAIERVVESSRRHEAAPAIMVDGVETGRAYLRRGFRCIAYSGDVWMLGQAVRAGIEGLRTAARELEGGQR